MLRHVGRHLLHPVAVLEHVPQRDRLLQNLVQVLDVADALRAGQAEELLLQRLAVHAQFIRRERVVERHGRPVLDGLADGILVEIALLVLDPNTLTCPCPAPFVNRRAGEAQQRGVGRRAQEVIAQVAARGAVRLVHQDEDVRASVDILRDLAPTCTVIDTMSPR